MARRGCDTSRRRGSSWHFQKEAAILEMTGSAQRSRVQPDMARRRALEIGGLWAGTPGPTARKDGYGASTRGGGDQDA